MKIMGSSGTMREDIHWGQCFEEFYGPEYCKNLKKDLEKLKDEFYDGNAQRFQREWVVPTANLLRRMRHMGFPVRTREYIIIHLYNPVDSMFAGEMHFQVGRKAPGTLTLKFTKQNSNGLFVIQPKTLSNMDETKLQEDPLDLLNNVRMEMWDNAIDAPNLLQTLVLMTETCKLQRQSAKVFFSTVRENAASGTTPLNNHASFHDVLPTPQFGAISVPFTNSQWQHGIVNPDSIRQDGNFQFPLNFCVKNYVTCNPKPEIKSQKVLGNNHHRLPNGPQAAGVNYRQSRSSTIHSEPEENDETMNLQSFTENNWPRMPPDSLEEIQRRMSDTHLWEASKGTCPSIDEKQPNNLSYGQPFRHYGPSIPEIKAWGGETRTSLTDEYTGDAPEFPRRLSEQRTYSTEEYCQSAPTMPPPIRKTSGERTSTTESYAGEAVDKGHKEFTASSHTDDRKTDPPGDVSPRTAVVNDYAAGPPPPEGPRYPFMPWQSVAGTPSFQQRSAGVIDRQNTTTGPYLTPDTSEGRRTSSLDAYVGNGMSGLKVSAGDPRARSEGNLAASRTNIVDQYFQSQKTCAIPMASRVTSDHTVNGHVPQITMCYDTDISSQVMATRHQQRGDGHKEPEESINSLDSWMSHAGSASLMAQNNRLRASSFGAEPARDRYADEDDMSLLSHTSYPSWGSHPAVHMNRNGGMLPLAIEQINNDAQNWQKYAPQNSLT